MNVPFRPSGVITLTTDIGHQGPFVASMKGIMLTRTPGRTHHRPHPQHFGALAGRGRFLARALLSSLSRWAAFTWRWSIPGSAQGATSSPSRSMAMSFWPQTTAYSRRCSPSDRRCRRFGRSTCQSSRAVGHHSSQRDFPRSRHLRSPGRRSFVEGRCRIEELGPPTGELIPSWVDEPGRGTGSGQRVS